MGDWFFKGLGLSTFQIHTTITIVEACAATAGLIRNITPAGIRPEPTLKPRSPWQESCHHRGLTRNRRPTAWPAKLRPATMRAACANVAGTAAAELDPWLLRCRSRPPPLGEPGSAARLKLALRASQEFRHKRESAEPAVQSLRRPSCPRSPMCEDRQQENLLSPNSPLLKRGRRSWQFQERFLCRRGQQRNPRSHAPRAPGNPTPPPAPPFTGRPGALMR